jgi:flagellar hook-basal body complex protein FliE
MDLTFINTLDKQTGRYVREALSDTDTDSEVRAQLAGVTTQAAEVAQDVQAGASPDDALAFSRDLDSFLTKAKTKALEAKRVETDIDAKLAEVAQVHAEIHQLSASMPALAEAVNKVFDKYEEVSRDYNEQEFKIATLTTRLSMRRAELAELRRRLEQIKTREVQA